MAFEVANAISAYNSAVNRVKESAQPGGETAGTEFSNMVKNFADSAIASGKGSEKLSAAAAAGQADINQVVVAVAEAEVTLNTVVAVRDRVIEAYREVLRMPI